MFYANLCISKDNGELETLVLGTRIILNDILFEEIFYTNFSGVVPLMSGIWPKNLKLVLKKQNKQLPNLW